MSASLKPAKDDVQKPTSSITEMDFVDFDNSDDDDQNIVSNSTHTIDMAIEPINFLEIAATISTSSVTEHVKSLLHESTNKIGSIDEPVGIPKKTNNKDEYVKPRPAAKRTLDTSKKDKAVQKIDARNFRKNKRNVDLLKGKSKNKSKLEEAVPKQIESRTKRTKPQQPAELSIDADHKKNGIPKPRSKQTIASKTWKSTSIPNRVPKRAAADDPTAGRKKSKGCGASQQKEFSLKIQSKEEPSSPEVTATKHNDAETSASSFKIPKVLENESNTLKVKNFGFVLF